MKSIRYFLLFAFAACVSLAVGAQVMTPDDMEYKDASGLQYMVSDPAGLLSPDVRQKVEQRLSNLRRQSTAEVAVVIPPEIGDADPQEWCEELFTKWHIGKKDRDNGLLLMISPGSRKAFILTGYGMEGVFTDIACKKIIDKAVIPAMKENNLDAAVDGATMMIANAISDPAAAAELRSGQSENIRGGMSALDPAVLWKFVRVVVALMFLCSLLLFIRDCVASRKFRGNYSKAGMWRSHLTMYFWVGLLSLGAGLIFLLLAYLLYRSWRNRPLKCSTCGARMKRLPEDKDNELLNDSQDFEEQLKTVDYDVWECPKCGTVERFPYRANQKKYTECPRCHTVAMCLDCDMTVRPATVRTEGEGVKIYECKYCHNSLRKPYRIPRKEDPSAAMAAGAILGSTLGRGGGGGMGGGGGFGGFGGGATGGGGAGGSW